MSQSPHFQMAEVLTQRTRLCGNAGGSRHVAVLWLLLAGCGVALPAGRPTEPLIQKVDEPASQSIPLLIASTPTGPQCASAVLQWMAPSDEAAAGRTNLLEFQFREASSPEAADMMRSQMWLPALASAIAWQQPWRHARWAVREPPLLDGPDNNLALGIGLIATASQTLFPQDMAAIGTINPDNSIGAVTDLDKRLAAAAKAGIRQVVMPAAQRIYASSSGAWLAVEDEATKLGLKCVLVDTFDEAVEHVLNRRLPSPPAPAGPLRHNPEIFRFLNERCERTLKNLDTELNVWRRRIQLGKLESVEARLLEQAVHLHEAGISAHRAGQPYYAREVLLEARARLAAISGWQAAGQTFDPQAQQEHAQLLRKVLADRMTVRPSFDRDDLSTALLVAEHLDWLARIQARLEGAQVLARQALATTSDASEGHRAIARQRLVAAIHETRLLLQDQEADFYTELARLLRTAETKAEAGQPQFWADAMVPTCLAAGEVLFRGLKHHADRFKETFVFDPRLASCARVLRDTKLSWDARQEWDKRQVINRDSTSGRLGFNPGLGYQEASDGKTAPPPQRDLSPTADCLSRANDLCEIDALRSKYLVMEGAFDPGAARWLVRSDAMLERMIALAEIGARRGVAFTEKLGIDPAVLHLICERASGLRSRSDAEERIEALRQFWRCSLLGSLCWQLSLPAPPPSSEAPTVEAAETVVRRALPASENSISAPVATPVTPQTPLDPTPPAIPAEPPPMPQPPPNHPAVSPADEEAPAPMGPVEIRRAEPVQPPPP